MTTIINDWITIAVQRNGVNVQRKFAGLDTYINQDNEVEYCFVKYWERELYPNGEVIKTELKKYSLEDLSQSINDEEEWRMEARAVLTGFINNLGYPYIINPARQTLTDHNALPVTVEDGYPLHRDTRNKIAN